MSRATHEMALMQWQCMTPEHPEIGYISRLDHAEWTGGGRNDYCSLCPGTGPLNSLRPGALVVRPGDMSWFRRYALTQAYRGVIRGVFTDPVEALEWVQKKALVLFPA